MDDSLASNKIHRGKTMSFTPWQMFFLGTAVGFPLGAIVLSYGYNKLGMLMLPKTVPELMAYFGRGKK